MKDFPEQLIEARKKHGMTQDGLAAALHITRSTVSHWENGRYLPSPEQLQALRDCLGEELEVPEEPAEPEAAPETAVPANEAAAHETPAETSAAPVKRRIPFLLPAVAFLLGAAAALFLCLFVFGKEGGDAPVSPMPEDLRRRASRETAEFFSLAAAAKPETGKPFVYITFDKAEILPAYDAHNKTAPGWSWEVYLTECGGSLFCVDGLSVWYFGSDGKCTHEDYSGEQCLSWLGGDKLDACCTRHVGFSMGVQSSIRYVGVQVTGHDEAGEEFIFSGYAPVSAK